MLRYYGKDDTVFACEKLIERHKRLRGSETRVYESYDRLYQSFREDDDKYLMSVVEKDGLMATDISIQVLELLFKGKQYAEKIKFYFDQVYTNSYKKDFLVHEAVVFHRNLHHVQTSYKTRDCLELFEVYLERFIDSMCMFYPSHVSKLHVDGGLVPVHAALQIAGAFRKRVLTVLVKNGADINQGDKYGSTPLHHAAWDGSLNNCQVLLKLGAHRGKKDNGGKTPYEIALSMENYKVAELLVSKSKGHQLDVSDQRWTRYDMIECIGGPLEFSSQVTKIPKEPDIGEFIQALLKSKKGSKNPSLVPGAMNELKTEVSLMLKQVAHIVSSKYDQRFAFEPLLTGSVAQGGKVGRPDEFDYNCVLTNFSEICYDQAEPGYPGFCRLKVRERVAEEYVEFFTKEGFLDFKKVNTRLYMLIERALSDVHFKGYGADNSSTILIINPPYRQVKISTIAYKMFLRCNSKHLKNVHSKTDLAAALTFVPKSFKLEPFMGIDKCMFIHIDDNNTAGVNCRISMTLQENAMFRSFTPEMVDSYGLLKAMLSILSSSWILIVESVIAPGATANGIDKLGMDLIPSTYHFKHSIIRAVLNHQRTVPAEYKYREVEFWAKETVLEMSRAFDERFLSTPWLTTHNIMEDHIKRRKPHVVVPPNGIERCMEYLKAHANILRCILNQENTVEDGVLGEDDFYDQLERAELAIIPGIDKESKPTIGDDEDDDLSDFITAVGGDMVRLPDQGKSAFADLSLAAWNPETDTCIEGGAEASHIIPAGDDAILEKLKLMLADKCEFLAEIPAGSDQLRVLQTTADEQLGATASMAHPEQAKYKTDAALSAFPRSVEGDGSKQDGKLGKETQVVERSKSDLDKHDEPRHDPESGTSSDDNYDTDDEMLMNPLEKLDYFMFGK